MILGSIKDKLKIDSIFFSEDAILDKPSVIGYQKKFKWAWMATQLNTFIVATDMGNNEITTSVIEAHLTDAFKYASKNYKGWPRGFQSGLGVIAILISTNIDNASKTYCHQLKSGKKWAGFSIPVVIDANTKEIFAFESKPIWGAIYYPHFKKLIKQFTNFQE